MLVTVLQQDWGPELSSGAAEVWRGWAPDLDHRGVTSGHVMAEAAPAEVVGGVPDLLARPAIRRDRTSGGDAGRAPRRAPRYRDATRRAPTGNTASVYCEETSIHAGDRRGVGNAPTQ
jgi:hypothetical protein